MIDASDPMAKEEEQYSVFVCVFFFGFVGVYKVEEKKKERLQIRLFFCYNGEKNNVWSENDRRSTNVQEKRGRGVVEKSIKQMERGKACVIFFCILD